MIRRPPRSTQSRSSAASDVYKRQGVHGEEAVRVPQREQELADHLVDHVGAEAPRAPRVLAGEHEPAKGVRALVVEDVVGLHHVALALAHLLAVGVEDCLLYTSDAADDLLCV